MLFTTALLKIKENVLQNRYLLHQKPTRALGNGSKDADANAEHNYMLYWKNKAYMY